MISITTSNNKNWPAVNIPIITQRTPIYWLKLSFCISKTTTKLFSSLRELLLKRIQQAIGLRKSILLPRANTSVYRLVNGEGDNLGGLIIDVLGNLVVYIEYSGMMYYS